MENLEGLINLKELNLSKNKIEKVQSITKSPYLSKLNL